MKVDPDGQAFPGGIDETGIADGMTIRTWLFGMVLQGLCSIPNNPDHEDPDGMACFAAIIVDAGIAELNKETP